MYVELRRLNRSTYTDSTIRISPPSSDDQFSGVLSAFEALSLRRH